MKKVRFVGLDVHRDTITIGVADDDGSAPEIVATVPHDLPKVVKRLKELGKGATLKCCYEAGPTGFGLHFALKKVDISCIVVAPSQVPDARGNRVKTDDRDAIRLARFLRSGDLSAIFVPDGQTEAMRDLSRAREGALKAKQVARQQLSGFLLRHGRAYDGGRKQGTKAHRLWMGQQQFEHEAQRRVLADYLAAYDSAVEREKKLVRDIEELLPKWTLEPVVRALMALRGVSAVSAVTLVAEVGDFARFATAPHFASYMGLTPSEHSSGNSQVRGSITKAGNSHSRRILIEAAWHYRFGHLSPAIRLRGEQAGPEARAIAQKAQDRLHRRYQALTARGKEKNKVAVAIGRELGCFVWSIATNATVLAQVESRKKLAA